MCMSPDEMSDDRIREVVKYHDQARQSGSRYHQAMYDNFSAILAERGIVAAVEEVFTAVTVEQPQRETVSV